MPSSRFASGLFVSSSLVFLLSGLVSVWASVDRVVARERLLSLALGLVAAYALWLMGRRRPNLPGKLGLVFACAAAIVGATYIAMGLPETEGVAGGLVVLILLGAAGAFWGKHSRRSVLAVSALVALGIAVAGLVATSERSAWLGLAAGTVVGSALVWRYGSTSDGPASKLVDLAGLVATATLVGGLLVVGSNPGVLDGLSTLSGGTDYSRLQIWQDGLQLVQDYGFTGIGLGQTGMVLSTYVYLYHVPFLFQTYDLYLQLAVEQGLPGLIGFAGITTAAVWRVFLGLRSRRSPVVVYSGCALAALVGVSVHGVLDAGLYVGMWSPLLLLPAGMAMGLAIPSEKETDAAGERRMQRYLWSAFGALAPVALIAVVLLWPGGRAAWQANLAAVEQTRMELGAYRWPEWAFQDDLRRSDAIDLRGVVSQYEAALLMDPGNTTAHRRLGQIAVSLGDLGEARSHLEAAYELSPHQRTTRQLLGEVYAISGEIDRAVNMWSSGVTDPHKLELRQAWYRELNESRQAEWMNEAARRYRHAVKQGR